MAGGEIPEPESPRGSLGVELRLIRQGHPIAALENRKWKPAIAYCRYADDFVVIVKGTKAHAMEIREECRAFLEDRLKLTLNMEKTHITHVNDAELVSSAGGRQGENLACLRTKRSGRPCRQGTAPVAIQP